MYNEHWQLSQRPFENSVRGEFYYPAETHQAALLKMHYAIENRRAAALLCGPGGMGKSLVVDALSKQLSDSIGPIVNLVFPAMNEEQLVRYLVNHVDPQQPGAPSETWSDLARFETFLKESSEAGKHPVVIVDEAHFLEQYGLLQPLRLLLNIGANEADGESAWTLILVGEPTLLSQVERYHALDERLSVKCLLNRLREEETASYIQHRLRTAGSKQGEVFSVDAIQQIHTLSGGIPRRINRLCDLSLMVGFAEDLTEITADTVEQVHSDLAAPQVA